MMEKTGTLFIVGTPIGNLSDFSPRGLETLKAVDFIAAEDTRVTAKLLHYFGLHKELISCFEHNERARSEYICSRLEKGESCALVTDAGMPAISDPGQVLVAQCTDCGIPVLAVPGPTAFATALAVSGLPSGRFTFEGFLSVTKKSRMEHLVQLKEEERTMLFYEAPHKLAATLRDMLATWGNRRLALVRELTKIHEEVIHTTLAEAVERYADGSARGEFVLVIEGAAHKKGSEIPAEEAADLARSFLREGLSTAEAARRAAGETGVKKNEIYKLLLQRGETQP